MKIEAEKTGSFHDGQELKLVSFDRRSKEPAIHLKPFLILET
tara:strand:+ start:758 stop:883 length:126 start_codon:yes stop_codon:yes gene_type:complete